MRQADIQQGSFYVGGKRQRIREVLVLLADFEGLPRTAEVLPAVF
jgi:hypothetical protein